MGVTIKFIPDPFKPHRWTERHCEPGLPAIDAVRATFPEFLDAPVLILRNSRRLSGTELLEAGDTIVVGVAPEGAAFGAAVLKAVIAALISAAVSYLVSALTKPKPRDSNAKSASPSYSIQLDQNAARLGDIVPVCYGRNRIMPDIASQPYSEFVNHNERAYMILCMGMGEFHINDVYVGESRVRDLPQGNVVYWQLGPFEHYQQLGHIERVTGVNEDMATIAESTGIEISAPNDPSEASVIATVSGAVLTPLDSGAWNVWAGLVPGRLYNVANSTGGGITAAFVGIGANNSSVWDRNLPMPTGADYFDGSMILMPYNDAARGPMAYMQFTNTHTFTVGELILIQHNGNTLGPFEIFERRPNTLVWNLFISGTGWQANMGPGNGIWPSQAARVVTSGVVNWTVSEYQPGTNPAEPFRWLGWFMTGRSTTLTNRVYVDVVMPNGVAWITDKGNYVNFNVQYAIEIQQVDSDGQPVGGVMRENRTISGATMTARKVTWPIDLPVARYRIRVARITKRDDAASKEVSNATLFSVRFRVYHPPETPAYENCTLLVLQFTAGSGLAAAASRRVTVDASRLIPDFYSGAPSPTYNPAAIVRDAYVNTDYGGARPWDEFDTPKFSALYAQWQTTPGFNAIYDSQITLIEAMQQMLNVVRAIPTPTGRLMSVTQDAPRPAAFNFDDANTVVDSLTVGYGFDGEDIPDCLEIVYTNPVTYTEARVYYPTHGDRAESLELFGCTNEQQALAWAKCVWQDRIYNHKTCELELEAEGYLLGPLTRFGLAVPILSTEQSGRITQYDPATQTVVFDAPLGPQVDAVSFVGDDARQTAPIGFISIDITRTIAVLNAVPPVAIFAAENSRDATVYRAGRASEEYFSMQCVNIQTGGAMRVRVSGKQYSSAAYAGTFVENWITGE